MTARGVKWLELFSGYPEGHMVSKCANPACSARFRYLHEGKLFRIEHPFTRNPARAVLMADTTARKPPMQVEFFWLCPDCCQSMTLIVDPAAGVTTRPLRRALRAAG